MAAVALPFPHRCGREKGGWLPCSLDGDAAADSDPNLKHAKAGERFVGWPASQCWGADHVAVSRGHNTAGKAEQLRLEVPVLGSWPSY